MIQLPLFEDEAKLSPDKQRGSISRNGTREAVSRYSDLRVRLDHNPFNQNWFDIDTLAAAPNATSLNFLDLFSGGGGLSWGFKQADFSKIFSVEIDKDASSTIKRNFPESIHFEGRIEDVSNYFLDTVIGERTVQVICGGPPCQGFSVAGLRDPNDPRNQLFRQFIRIVQYVQPMFVVLENVPGILTIQDGTVYSEIIRQFDEIGYPGMSVRILEAAEYGVPQLRTRAIFVGNRLGLENPYPRKQRDKTQYLAIEAAIDDLKDVPRDASINHEWTDHSPHFEERLSHVPPGGSLYSNFRDAFKRQYRGLPAMTIKENHGGVHIHYEKNRVLSAREMARLQTFPDNYIFAGTMKRAYWQIGNAVPCLLAKNIGTAIRVAIEANNKPKLETTTLKSVTSQESIMVFTPLL